MQGLKSKPFCKYNLTHGCEVSKASVLRVENSYILHLFYCISISLIFLGEGQIHTGPPYQTLGRGLRDDCSVSPYWCAQCCHPYSHCFSQSGRSHTCQCPSSGVSGLGRPWGRRRCYRAFGTAVSCNTVVDLPPQMCLCLLHFYFKAVHSQGHLGQLALPAASIICLTPAWKSLHRLLHSAH